MVRKNYLIKLALLLLISTATLAFLTACDTGQTKECVVMLGDSIFDLSGEEPAELMELADQQWRTYYQSGAELSGGNLIAPKDIEGQLDDAIDDGSIRTIIMDGGGNDFLLGDGSSADVEDELKQAWGRILDKAMNAGVKTLIFQGYYETTTATDAQMAVNDEIIAWLPAQGAARGINVYTYNPNADVWFTSQRPASYTIYDGIHPDTAASEHMAEMLWDIMVQNDIEQGTCEEPSDTGGEPVDGISGTYSIIATHSGKALDVWEFGTVDGTNIAQYDFWGGDAQIFNIAPVDDIWHRITPIIATDQSIEVANCATESGANVQTWSYTGVTCQQWRFVEVAEGQYQIIARHSSLCMDVLDASLDDGANVMQSTCIDGAAHQTFKLVDPATGTGTDTGTSTGTDTGTDTGGCQ